MAWQGSYDRWLSWGPKEGTYFMSAVIVYVKIKTIFLISEVREYDRENIPTTRKHAIILYYRIYTVHIIQYIELIHNVWLKFLQIQ